MITQKTVSTKKYAYINGDKYIGSFVDDLRDGYGILTYSNGDTYSGNWVQGFCSGYGVYTWKNGKKYTSKIKDISNKHNTVKTNSGEYKLKLNENKLSINLGAFFINATIASINIQGEEYRHKRTGRKRRAVIQAAC